MELKKLLPDAPQMGAKALDAWLRENGGRGREVMRYRKRVFIDPLSGEKLYYAECECTACRQKMDTEIFLTDRGYPHFKNFTGPVENGSLTQCPYCGTQVEAAYYDRLRRHPITKTRYPWEIVKKDGCVFFICWAVIHEVGHDYDSITAEKRNAYVIDSKGKWHRFTGQARCGWSSLSPMYYTGSWYEKERFDVKDGNPGFLLPYATDVFEGTMLENAKLEKLLALNMGVEFLLYARIYMNHKTIENLAMQSPHLMAALCWWAKGVTGLNWLDWKAKKPHEMLRITKPEYKKLCSLQGDKAKKAISLLYKENACVEWGISKDYAETLGTEGAAFAFSKKNKKEMRQFGLVTIWNYILKQKEKNVDAAVKLCKDYWNDLPKVGADMSDRAVMFPANLKIAHARVISAIKYQEDEALRKKFLNVHKKLSALQWEKDGLLIVPAASESELIAEGKVLGHCVGGYGKAHCSGDSIFFIRHSQEREVPYFTLQLNTKTGRVLQNRGEHNCDRTNEVEAFEQAWLATVVMPWIKQKKKRKTA